MRRWHSLLATRLPPLVSRSHTSPCRSYLQSSTCTAASTGTGTAVASHHHYHHHNHNHFHHRRRRFHSRNSKDEHDSCMGLFSIPELQSPHDFSVVTQHAIRECNRLRSTIAATTQVTTRQDASLLLHQLDDISKTVCNVIDAAELCRSVHANTAWREAAQHTYTVLSDYISRLNADTTLYQALCLVQSNTAIYTQLSEEERRFAVLLQAEFERDGIHLPNDKRETVRQLQASITELEGTFSYNLIHSRQLFTIENSSAVTDVIPEHVLLHYGATMEQKTDTSTSTSTSTPTSPSNERQVRLGDTDSTVLQTLLKHSPDSDLRRSIHWHSVTAIPENCRVLDALVTTRHALATTQGFGSYVERNVPDKMARSASAIQAFLHQAANDNKALFRKEMETLSKAKQRMEGGDGTIQAWDTSFYVGLLSHTEENGHAAALSDLSHYFTVSHTLASMQLLVDRLFGIVMQEEPLSRIEQWDVVQDGTPSTLRKYSFSCADQPLGIMYLDLHPREAKYGHAAHFTVRCGCAIHCDSTARSDTNEPSTTLLPSENYQQPIVSLVCNLSSHTVISHSEVETLFHEFGHALHSLLSRTKFQHMSGTRAALDFVETPSHLLEHFVWDAHFLSHLGRHYVTGEPLPVVMIQQLRSSRYHFAALERQNQILHSMFDQKLFGVPEHTHTPAQDLFSRLHETYDLPFVKGSHWYSRFGHLVSYGAGYYGYLYAQGFARQIWDHCLQGHSLDASAGRNVWQKLLVHGGARDPHAMLTDLLGRPP